RGDRGRDLRVGLDVRVDPGAVGLRRGDREVRLRREGLLERVPLLHREALRRRGFEALVPRLRDPVLTLHLGVLEAGGFVAELGVAAEVSRLLPVDPALRRLEALLGRERDASERLVDVEPVASARLVVQALREVLALALELLRRDGELLV